MNNITRPVWVEINLDNLKFNLRQIKKELSSETMVMAVVKADAYGHGAEAVAKTLIEEGLTDWVWLYLKKVSSCVKPVSGFQSMFWESSCLSSMNW